MRRDGIEHLLNTPETRICDLRGEALTVALRERHEQNRARWLAQTREAGRSPVARVMRSLFGRKANG